MRLKRELSKTSLLLLSIGSIVGSGWLFGSFYAAQLAGPASILSWLIGGAFVAFVALTLAELCSMLPLASGSTIFVTLTHGKFAGSIFSWTTWLWAFVVAPIEVQAVLQYASNYLPEIFSPNTHHLSPIGFLYATGLMLIMVIINLVGVRIMAKTNNFIVYWKLLIPIAIIAVLIFYRPHFSNITSKGFLPEGMGGVFSAISTGGIALSYFGFQTAIFLAGETKNPKKSIPFALFGSLLFCIVLYALLQFGFILSLDPSSIQNGWKQISFEGDAGPFAGIFLAFGMTFMIGVLYFDAIISPFGTGISYVASSSRILYSMGLQGDAPTIVSKTNRFSVPWVAILVNFLLGMLFFMPFSGWQEMASFLSAAIIVTLAVGAICLPIFRANYPELQRPFLLKYPMITSFVAFYICSLMLYWAGWNTLWKLEILVLVGVVVQFLFHFYNSKKLDFDIKTVSWIWIPVYLIFSAFISYFGMYGGGKEVLTNGPDFIVILISSSIVFALAQKFRLTKKRSHDLYEHILKNHQSRKEKINPV